VRYTYDGRGDRVAREADGQVTRYLKDIHQPALELDAGGQVRARYVHGDLADEVFLVTRGGVTYSYVTNARGDVVGLVGPDGRFARSYEYDDFGAVLASQGNLDDPLTFGARPLDPLTGLMDFRDRSYDPRTGRFLQVDPEKGSRLLPLTQVPYAYARNSPYLLRDPDGRDALITYAFLTSRIVGGKATVGSPNYYEMCGAFIGFFQGFGATALVFIANVLDLSGTRDIGAIWSEALDRTQAKMDEIEGALGRMGAVDYHGFAGGFLNGGGFSVGIKISINIPKPINAGLTLAGVKVPSASWSIS
jgi:RHS repeat-associated protein